MTLLMIIIELHSLTDYGDKRTFHIRPMLEMCYRYSVSNFTNSYVGISISLAELLIYIGQTGRPCPIKCKALWTKVKTLSHWAGMGTEYENNSGP